MKCDMNTLFQKTNSAFSPSSILKQTKKVISILFIEYNRMEIRKIKSSAISQHDISKMKDKNKSIFIINTRVIMLR